MSVQKIMCKLLHESRKHDNGSTSSSPNPHFCDAILSHQLQFKVTFFTPQLQDLSHYDQVTNNKLETFIFKFSMNPYLCLVSVTSTWNILHYIWLSHLWKYLLLCTAKNVSGVDPCLFVKVYSSASFRAFEPTLF